MHTEYRIAGPPGCGKTTEVARQVRRAAEKHGSKAVMCASYTRAAAVELAGRDMPVAPEQVGTLHAFGLRALGRPRVVDQKLLPDWNERHPKFQMKGGRLVDPDDPVSDLSGGADGPGDELLARYDLLRARQVSAEKWPASIHGFASEWEAWKAENDAVDFADMISRPLLECPIAPGNPTVGFFDEFQDCSRAEAALIRHWAGGMDYVVCVGDDDQAIYEWRGADPECLIVPPLEPEYLRILSQSYRVPRAIHQQAVWWIEKVKRRLPKIYNPRDDEGRIIRSRTNYKNGIRMVGELGQYLADGKTVAFLGSCSYHLSAVMHELRQQGIPFHNPWRRTRGDWNPLQTSRGVGVKDRLIAYLGPSLRGDRRAWTIEELKLWTSLVKSDEVLLRGAKSEIAASDKYSYEDLRRWLVPEAITAGRAGDVPWLLSHCLKKQQEKLRFPARIVERSGVEALRKRPQVVVSTIHGMKGAEVDVVVLIPDLSRKGYDTWLSDSDSVRRLFYVAMTRARETLVLCQPADGCSVCL